MIEDQGLPNTRSGVVACSRASLLQAITAFLTRKNVPSIAEVLPRLERLIDEAEPEALTILSRSLAEIGKDWGYYAKAPLVRRLHHVFADQFLQVTPVVLGSEQLAVLAEKPLVIFMNHLSYADAHVLDFLLHKVEAKLSERLTVVAGPKVYSNIGRRFSSLCFGTIRTPQNSVRASGEAVMNTRQVAHAALRSLQVAEERLRLGDALLVFAEGTRSRTGQMQQLLPGTVRYLRSPNTWVLPLGITGTERLFPIGEESLNPVPIQLRIGRPIQSSLLAEFARGDRRLLMDYVGFAIAALLPPEYRGFYSEPSVLDQRLGTCPP